MYNKQTVTHYGKVFIVESSDEPLHATGKPYNGTEVFWEVWAHNNDSPYKVGEGKAKTKAVAMRQVTNLIETHLLKSTTKIW
jgi:hypothetical protein